MDGHVVSAGYDDRPISIPTHSVGRMHIGIAYLDGYEL